MQRPGRRRSEGAGEAPVAPPASAGDRVAGAAAAALWAEFVAAELRSDPLGSRLLVAAGDELHALPAGAPPLEGIRVLRPGWWLGTVRPGRFEPSHALALAIDPAQAARVRDWPAGSREIGAYLAGEALPDAGEPGWVLVTVDGFPLGWGKRSGDTLKNHYPRGLRTR